MRPKRSTAAAAAASEAAGSVMSRATVRSLSCGPTGPAPRWESLPRSGPRPPPAAIGLPGFGGRRRVAGLRREEVALVAGMSVEYCVRLERGNAAGVSEAVLDGIARALKLDDAEVNHLHDL